MFERDLGRPMKENSLISPNKQRTQLVCSESNSAPKSPVQINPSQDSSEGQAFPSEQNKEQFCYSNIDEQHNQSTLVPKMFENGRMENLGNSDFHRISLEDRRNKVTNDVKNMDHLFNCRFCLALFETEQLLIEHETIHLFANEQEASHMSVNGEEATSTITMSVSGCESIHNSAKELDAFHANVKSNETYYPSTSTTIYPTITSSYQISPKSTLIFNCDLCNISFGSAKYLKEHSSLVHRQTRVNNAPLGIRITSAFSIQRENGSTDTEISQRGQWNDGVLVLDSCNESEQGFAVSGSSASEAPLGRGSGEFGNEYGQNGICLEVNKFRGSETGNRTSIGASNLWFSPSKPSAKETSIFKCRICSIEFKKLEGLKSHAKCHLRPAGYQCSICKRKFTKKWNLDAHMRSHTRERPYECDVCGDRFIMKHHLKRHAETHDKKA